MADDALARLQSGAAEIAPEGGLVEKLSLGRPLRVKLGLDPTAPVVTLGWAVVLRKLREFQDAGHQAVLIVGDFTARVGDPSGRSSTRPTLSKEQVDAFADRLLSQLWKVIDRDRVALRRNSEWLEPLGVEDVLRLTASTTVARMVELGGTDQLFNLLVGRELQKDVGQDPQIALTMPLLEGLDGVQKMSQSLGNYVGVDEPPENMFGKLMSIPDGVIARYELLCTDLGPEDNVRVVAGLADGSLHPNTEKRRMARAIVDLYHGAGSGEVAERRFDLVHKQHRIPGDVQDVRLPKSVFREEQDGSWIVHVPALLEAMGLVSSRSEARRLLAQGGVRMNGQPQPAEDLPIEGEPPGPMAGSVWQVGRRRFARFAGLTD
ncbi:MAG: tyrosine--tRNA ligase [Actinobacteria bacterium]|nr:MAG: tyrosine--tRNA ligase [Actinomycetota bacterium]